MKMREKRKDGMLSYGFLLDRDVSKAASLFPKKRTKTIADIGLPQNATDTEIVTAAWERQLTIVTGNGDDFVREITRFLDHTKKTSDGCHEVFGLIVLPNGYERQRRLLQNVEQTLRLGKEAITWTDVAQRNCYVRVKRSGGTEVKRFPRCLYCQKNEMKYKT
jgi:Domain of unknown function (DUF5615)